VRDRRSLTSARVGAVLAALALILGACTSKPAGWTFAPEPSPTAAPSTSAAPSGSAAASGSVAPSGSAAPSASGSSGPSGSGSATVIKVVALNIAYDTPTIQVPGGQPFTIDFDNQDNGIPHNIEIKDANGGSAFKGDIITGPAKASYQVPPLTKGTAYTFVCDVHPTMTGTVTVQ
jgi:plastocyanin